MNLNTEVTTGHGPSPVRARSLRMVALAIMLTSIVVTGCKATSTLTVSLGEKASGIMKFSLVLDKEASRAVRRDAYNASTLTKIFDTTKLKAAGFAVNVVDKAGDASRIDISARFSNEKQLQSALAVLAPPKVLNAELVYKTSIINEKQNATLTIDVAKLRSMYLDDPSVKKAVVDAGIDFSEFQKLVNDSMKSTSLNVTLSRGPKHQSSIVTGDAKKPTSLEVSHDVFRTRYVTNMAGAAIAILLALVLIWRACRTPRLLSKHTTVPAKHETDQKKFR